MLYFSGKGCSEFPKKVLILIGILNSQAYTSRYTHFTLKYACILLHLRVLLLCIVVYRSITTLKLFYPYRTKNTYSTTSIDLFAHQLKMLVIS